MQCTRSAQGLPELRRRQAEELALADGLHMHDLNDIGVVVQVAAHAATVGDHMDAVRLKRGAIAHARQHEQLGRSEGARTEQHFATGPQGLGRSPFALQEGGAHRTLTLEHHLADMNAGDHPQVGATEMRREIRLRSPLAPARPLKDLVGARTFMNLAGAIRGAL